MVIDWNALGVTFSSTVVVVAGITYLAKAVFNQFLKRDIETHKKNLKSDADAALETLKTTLNTKANSELETLKSSLKTAADLQLEPTKHMWL